jgi:hypothetical protein
MPRHKTKPDSKVVRVDKCIAEHIFFQYGKPVNNFLRDQFPNVKQVQTDQNQINIDFNDVYPAGGLDTLPK